MLQRAEGKVLLLASGYEPLEFSRVNYGGPISHSTYHSLSSTAVYFLVLEVENQILFLETKSSRIFHHGPKTTFASEPCFLG